MQTDLQRPSGQSLRTEADLLREEVLVARRASEITAELVVAQFVEIEDVVAVFPDQNGLGALAGDGPGLDERVEELRGITPQNHCADEPAVGFYHRCDSVNGPVAIMASEKLRE